MPGREGTTWIKWLRRIKVTDAAVESRDETSRCTDTRHASFLDVTPEEPTDGGGEGATRD